MMDQAKLTPRNGKRGVEVVDDIVMMQQNSSVATLLKGNADVVLYLQFQVNII